MSEILIRDCECWEYNVSLVILEDESAGEAIRHVYCPSCSPGIQKDATCMVENNGWLIHYDPGCLGAPDTMVCLSHNLQHEKCILICMQKKFQPVVS